MGFFSKKEQWIPVTERMPQRLWSVILCDIDGNVTEGWLDTKSQTFYAVFNGEDEIEFNNVTHWMPLPQPPKR